MASNVTPVAIGLAIGIAFVILFAIYSVSQPQMPPKQNHDLVLPASASIAMTGGNFEPSAISVVIGVTNTVTWTNYEKLPALVSADNYTDLGFFNRTGNNPVVLLPNETFGYLFTKPEIVGYHGLPW